MTLFCKINSLKGVVLNVYADIFRGFEISKTAGLVRFGSVFERTFSFRGAGGGAELKPQELRSRWTLIVNDPQVLFVIRRAENKALA